jgi:hypothetical protein
MCGGRLIRLSNKKMRGTTKIDIHPFLSVVEIWSRHISRKVIANITPDADSARRGRRLLSSQCCIRAIRIHSSHTQPHDAVLRVTRHSLYHFLSPKGLARERCVRCQIGCNRICTVSSHKEGTSWLPRDLFVMCNAVEMTEKEALHHERRLVAPTLK